MDAVTALVAGVLTVLAPCVLPLLPIIVGGSLREGESKTWVRPLTITLSLVISVTIFTLLLRTGTQYLGIPESFWKVLSGAIIILFGITLVWPQLWEMVSLKLNISNSSNKLLAKASSKGGFWGDVLVGAALGPVFTSCSPTYALILATVIPVSFAQGAFYMLIYSLGLGVSLLVLALAGNKLISKLGWAADPDSKFRKVLGVIFIATGFAVMTGLDKDIEAWIIETGIYDPIVEIENNLAK